MIRFISDLHLDQKRPGTIRAFLIFLEDCKNNNVTELYILGDFFEFWIGDDAIEAWMHPIIASLKQSSKHFKIFLMHGNRDFTIGKKFAKHCAVKLIKDPTVIQLNNQRILIMHGDLLCTDDIEYLRFRKIIRNPLILTILMNLPLKIRFKLANSLRNNSKESMTHKPIDIMDATEQGVIKFSNKYNCDIIIHGHTHRPKIHKELLIKNKSVTRITLGDWGTSALGFEIKNRLTKLDLIDFLDL
ncbi:UDP-2,3-diacylglucosamine diphosphatase [Marinicellulosiphila megalodicopiae]|uniref:UDP-2,3-diacylglucosamine diphosphatase n=1 Tax=Marinicellulosiphila megalodicopiae TaxID=2724896 RepID=UPI003BB15B2A